MRATLWILFNNAMSQVFTGNSTRGFQSWICIIQKQGSPMLVYKSTNCKWYPPADGGLKWEWRGRRWSWQGRKSAEADGRSPEPPGGYRAFHPLLFQWCYMQTCFHSNSVCACFSLPRLLSSFLGKSKRRWNRNHAEERRRKKHSRFSSMGKF